MDQKQTDSQHIFSEDEKINFMNKALEQAALAFKSDQVPVGCVFVNDHKQIVESSHNQTNTLKNASRHCEINCIQSMESRKVQISSLTLFVTVEPCIMCAYALNLIEIKQVFFGQFNPRFGGCGSVLKASTFKFEGGILEEQSLGILKRFYDRGNLKIPEEMRNKARKRKIQQQ